MNGSKHTHLTLASSHQCSRPEGLQCAGWPAAPQRVLEPPPAAHLPAHLWPRGVQPGAPETGKVRPPLSATWAWTQNVSLNRHIHPMRYYYFNDGVCFCWLYFWNWNDFTSIVLIHSFISTQWLKLGKMLNLHYSKLLCGLSCSCKVTYCSFKYYIYIITVYDRNVIPSVLGRPRCPRGPPVSTSRSESVTSGRGPTAPCTAGEKPKVRGTSFTTETVHNASHAVN